MPFRFDAAVRRVLAGLLLAASAAAAQDCPPAAPALSSVPMDTLRQNARDRGLLWRLQKDGRTSWLYGTIHIGRLESAMPGPRIRAALAESEVVALELDPADPELPRILMAPRDGGRNEQVLAGLKPRLARAAERGCVPDALLAPMVPLMQMATLTVWELRRDGLHPELAVDIVLWGMARGLGKRIVGLESPALQLAAFTPESIADERELLETGLQDLESGRVRPLVRRLADLWAAGDEAALAAYPQWCECQDTEAERRFYAKLNDGRNPALADKLAALHAGQRFFAGIGALHMTGAQALPDLLRARGFDVQRVRFDPLPR